jgi:hypothetical protein
MYKLILCSGSTVCVILLTCHHQFFNSADSTLSVTVQAKVAFEYIKKTSSVDFLSVYTYTTIFSALHSGCLGIVPYCIYYR